MEADRFAAIEQLRCEKTAEAGVFPLFSESGIFALEGSAVGGSYALGVKLGVLSLAGVEIPISRGKWRRGGVGCVLLGSHTQGGSVARVTNPCHLGTWLT